MANLDKESGSGPVAAAAAPDGAQTMGANVYMYRDTPFDDLLTPRHRVEAVQSYDDVRDDDVVIATYPKAGTHWAADMALKIVHRGDLKKAKESDVGDILYEIEPPRHLAEQGIGGRRLAAPTLDDLSKLVAPRVICTHLPFHMLPQKVQDGRAKVIYVCRDPRDVAVSMWHQINTVQKMLGAPSIVWDTFFDSFIQGSVPYGIWSRNFKSYLDVKRQANVLVLYYEDMHEGLKGAVKSIAKFLNVDLDDGAVDVVAFSCSFEEAKKANPDSPFVRKGVVGGWQTQFTVAQSERFDAHMHKETYDLDLGMHIPYWPNGQIKVPSSIFGATVYRYQGLLFHEIMTPLSRVKDVHSYDDVRPDDVVIWTAPRSGTHWTCDIALKILNDGDIARANLLNWDGVTYEITPSKHMKSKESDLVPASLSELSAIKSPRVILTHLPFRLLPKRVQRGEAKVICVERDPRDAAVSMFHSLGHLFTHLDWNTFCELFLADQTLEINWWQLAQDAEKYGAKANVLRLRYENMKQDLKSAVRAVAGHLGKSLDEATVSRIAESCTVEEAKKAKPGSHFVRQGTSGGWKTYFTVRQSELLEERARQLRKALNLELPL